MAVLHGIQKFFIAIQNQCVQASEDLSRLVSKTAKQQHATLKDSRTQERVIDAQTRLLELSRFQALGSLQDEIVKQVLSLSNS